MTKVYTLTSIHFPKSRNLISIQIEKVPYIDSKESKFEGYLSLLVCKYADKPKLCSNISSPSYAYYTDYQNICLPLTSEHEPKTQWDVNYDLLVGLQEQ